VTEAITGLDLVEWQLLVASGRPLPLLQDQLSFKGHAIEARICAENPDNNFLPATGQLAVYHKPAHVGFTQSSGATVRIDDGVRQGDAISPYYDSMVAKLIVHGATREEALGKLDKALAETHIVGLTTNVQFLRHVLKTRSFAQANLDTALIPREEAVLFKQVKVGATKAVASAIAQVLQEERRQQGADPFSKTDGWLPYGIQVRKFEFDYQGESVTATLRYLHDGAMVLAVGEEQGVFSATPRGDSALTLNYLDEQTPVHCHRLGDVMYVFTSAGATAITLVDRLAHAGEVHAEGGRLTAPMPGKVVSFSVKAGDQVKKGQALAVMEAMKMEHTIAAPQDGEVGELLFSPGDQVAEGAELLRLVVAG
jgi:3-methylcrotonyl-CoA carboxylase alpha subunit